MTGVYEVVWSEVDWERIVLLLLFLAAFFLYGWNVLRMWADRTRSSNALASGLQIVIGYVTLGQIKAGAYDLPIDWVSYVGAVGSAVVIAALIVLQLGGRKRGAA